MENALKGITVLEVGTTTPGKFTGFLLAGWGASCIRVERPGAILGEQLSDEDLTLNRGKRSITLDLRHQDGLDILRKLAARSDVMMESYRPGTAARLGVDAATMRSVNPALVYCSLSAFGQDGPDSQRIAYDLNQLAETGMSYLTSAPNLPVNPGTYLADSVSGLMAAFGIAAALRHREATGEGATLDLGVQESLFSLLAVSHGTLRDDTSTPAPRAAYGVFETSDGSHLSLGVARPVSSEKLFGHLGRPDLASKGILRGEAGGEARTFLTETFATQPAAHWIAELQPLEIEIAPVNTPDAAFDSDQLVHRNMILQTDHPETGPLRQIGIPGVDARRLGPAPHSGANTDSLLSELDFSRQQIENLRKAGII